LDVGSNPTASPKNMSNFIRFIVYAGCVMAAYTYYGFPLSVIIVVMLLLHEALFASVRNLYAARALKNLTQQITDEVRKETRNMMPPIFEARHEFSAAPLTIEEQELYKKASAGDEVAANTFLSIRNVDEEDQHFEILPMNIKSMLVEQIYNSCPKTEEDKSDDWVDVIDDK
jgi:HAMP domain-containing protein